MVYTLKNIYAKLVAVFDIVTGLDRRMSDLEAQVAEIKQILQPDQAVEVKLTPGPVQEQP